MATEVGIVPVGRVVTILLELVFTTDTEPPLPLATTRLLPLGVTAAQSGEVNPEIVESRFPLESCTVTVPAFPLHTYTWPFGATVTAFGPDASAKVPTTVLDAVSIMDTLTDQRLATYALLPSGLKATAKGLDPTGMFAITALDAVSITETEAEPRFTTYTCAPLGLIAKETGVVPTLMVATTELLAVLMTETLFVPWHSR